MVGGDRDVDVDVASENSRSEAVAMQWGAVGLLVVISEEATTAAAPVVRKEAAEDES